MKTIPSIIVIILLSLLTITTAEAQKKKPVTIEPEFVQFWNEFKIAIQKQDKKKIIEMTAFPFYVSNSYDRGLNIIKNENEFKNRKLEEYAEATLSSIMGTGKLIKTIKNLKKLEVDDYRLDLLSHAEFKLSKDAKIVIARKEHCTLIFSMVNEKVKFIGVEWSPSDD